MTAENNEQNSQSPMLPSINNQKKGELASASSTKSRRPLNEKIVYRKSTLPNLGAEGLEQESFYDHTECPRCHSVISVKLNKNKNENEDALNKAVSRKSKTRLSRSQVMNDAASLISSCCECNMEKTKKAVPEPERSDSPRKHKTHLKKGKLYRSVDQGINWNDLNEKIEDWFEAAKTPDQKVVYHFLNDIKHENDIDETSSVYSEKITNKVKSLEGILDNLKQYRHKFQRQSQNYRSAGLPHIGSNKNSKSNSKLDNIFESSTWRVMRHIRSADVRNKYPLPKANPDEYFRNSTVFHVAGRVPNSTFLLHPEWV